MPVRPFRSKAGQLQTERSLTNSINNIHTNHQTILSTQNHTLRLNNIEHYPLSHSHKSLSTQSLQNIARQNRTTRPPQTSSITRAIKHSLISNNLRNQLRLHIHNNSTCTGKLQRIGKTTRNSIAMTYLRMNPKRNVARRMISSPLLRDIRHVIRILRKLLPNLRITTLRRLLKNKTILGTSNLTSRILLNHSLLKTLIRRPRNVLHMNTRSHSTTHTKNTYTRSSITHLTGNLQNIQSTRRLSLGPRLINSNTNRISIVTLRQPVIKHRTPQYTHQNIRTRNRHTVLSSNKHQRLE